MSDIYVIARKTEDGTLPDLESIYDERFFFSREEAEEFLNWEFASFMREKHDVFLANLNISALDVAVPFVLPDELLNENLVEEDLVDNTPGNYTTDDNRKEVYDRCRAALVGYCTDNKELIEKVLGQDLTNIQFMAVCDEDNWKTTTEEFSGSDLDKDYSNLNNGYLFYCKLSAGTLEATVSINSALDVVNVMVDLE